MPETPAGAPPSGRARIELVDALRAFALIGILQINVLSFVWGPTGLANFATPPSRLDQAVFLLLATFVSTKFIALFALLFGLGFALQLRGLRRRLADAAAARRTYRRRLWVLLALGIAHGVLLYFGDILTAYALCGFVLLLHARARPGALARAAAWWFGAYAALSLAVMLASEGAVRALRLSGAPAELPPDWIERFITYTEGGWGAQLEQRAGDYLDLVLQTLMFAAPFVIGLFVLGALAGRLGWLAHPARHPRVWRAARIVCSVSQAPAGRMPLTNYLLQSVAMGALLSGWGLGLGADLGVAALSALALAIVAVQLVVSRWWIARGGQGPVEAALRRLTYGAG